MKLDFKKIADQFRNLNPRDVGTWPILPRAATAVGIIVAVVAVGYFVFLNDYVNTLDADRTEEESLRTQYKSKLSQAVNLEPLRKQKEQIAQYVFRLEKQLPSKSEMDALLSDINQAGVGRGLQFELFKPGPQSVKDYYAEQPIDLKITGSYHDLGQFTSDIAALPRIVTLNNIAIATNDKDKGTSNLVMDAQAKTFRYLDSDEVANQRKAKAAAAAAKGPGK